MRTPTLALAAAAVLTLTLTACGGPADDSDTSATTTAPRTTPTPSPSIDTGDVKVDRLTEPEKRYVAALVKAGIDNGLTDALSQMEAMSATEVQSEIGKRHAKCRTKKQHTPEGEIRAAIDYFKGDVSEKNVRTYITAKDNAVDTYICN
ncbi:hypothetical protein [Streptomyces sp. MZ04]|uniref:hypothetical protein n=1 Tax=Streptomyces sp. MZ04 TaxID=2559236 RepID=UPI00107E7370|nr:hypothetical protein [Streptomyces sp. MZ04]TGA84723.1 hypothetical protein E2651_42315 [Streptomyces sp. MZ04]